MTPELWQRVCRALDQAADLEPEECAAFLHQVRATDPEVAREVECLVRERNAPALLESVRQRLLSLVITTTPDELPPAPPADVVSADVPQQVGPYLVEEELARGGMGVVLRAHDPKFQRRLAVKILASQYRHDDYFCRRFRDEAQIMGQLQHPGIPPVHDVGQLPDGRPFLAMKLIQGRTLAELLTNRQVGTGHREKDSESPQLASQGLSGPLVPVSDSRLLDIFEHVCQTLAYAHARGVIHRDLKPANIMVGEFGEVQVMDWGLAKQLATIDGKVPVARPTETAPEEALADLSSSQTQPGTVAGTPAYMAPEQACGQGAFVDERADVFGLGAILCQVLTGQPAYTGDTTNELIRQARTADLADARRRLDECGADGELTTLARRCLEPDLATRLRDAGQVADAVTAYRQSVQARLQQAQLERAQAEVRATEEQRRLQLERQKRRATIALAVVALLLIAGASATGLNYVQEKARKDAADQIRQQKLADEMATKLHEEARAAADLHEQLTSLARVYELTSDLDGWQRRLQRRRQLLNQAKKVPDDNPGLDAPQLVKRLADQEKQWRADQSAFDLARELDDMQMESFADLEKNWQRAAAGRKYQRFFRDRLKIDVTTGKPRSAAARVAGMPLRHVLVAALDHWADLSQEAGSDDRALLPRLLEVARLADEPNSWRQRFRQEAVWQDQEKLAQLAGTVVPGKQPPPILLALANQWERQSGVGVTVLQGALVHYPRDFWLNLTAANLLKDSPLTLGYYQAALAVRPQSAVAAYGLGRAQLQFRKLEQAGRAFEKVIACNRGRYNLGRTYAALGEVQLGLVRFQEAEESLRQAQGLLGKDAAPAMHARLADLLQKCPEYRKVQNLERRLPVVATGAPAVLRGQLRENDPAEFCPLAPDSRRKAHAVRLQGGRSYQIDLHSTDFDTFLRVETDQWQPLVFNDDVCPGDSNSRLVFTPADSGLYRLIVNDFVDPKQPRKFGAYTLTVREVVATESLGEIIAAVPTRDTVRNSKFMGELRITDKTVSGKFVRDYQVKLMADRPYVLALQSWQFDTYLQLLDGTGKKELAYNDDLAPDNVDASRIDFTPQTTGDYMVRVTSFRPGETGAYTLAVQGYGPPRR